MATRIHCDNCQRVALTTRVGQLHLCCNCEVTSEPRSVVLDTMTRTGVHSGERRMVAEI